jgi:hypothetical protein
LEFLFVSELNERIGLSRVKVEEAFGEVVILSHSIFGKLQGFSALDKEKIKSFFSGMKKRDIICLNGLL